MAEHIDSKGQKDCVTDDQRQFMSKTGKIAPEHGRTLAVALPLDLPAKLSGETFDQPAAISWRGLIWQ
jgi:hypothetical protein